MKRLLLLLPTRGYRAQAFVEAAARLEIELTVASEEPSTMAGHNPWGLLTLDFQNPATAAQQVLEFARQFPLDAVVGVDDATTTLQAMITEALGIPSNSFAAVSTARNKFRMREVLGESGIPGPPYWLFSVEDDPDDGAASVSYPCVVKPLVLSGSRGVVRANNQAEFVEAFHRLAALLKSLEAAGQGEAARQVLVEGFIPGKEVALEGLLEAGQLRVLALFDKPDPLDGPFFEETLYVTPSRLDPQIQDSIASLTARAAKALGLNEGPLHAELRVGLEPVILEINPRSIGGKCSRSLRFGAGLSLEEIILRRALGLEIPSLEREKNAAGVMMIPIPRGGTLMEIRGQEAARSVPGIEEISLAAYAGQRLVPLPEGAVYLGFIFARGGTPEFVEEALRAAHRRLEVVVE